MTDNEIIKALECCARLNYVDGWSICKTDCPYKSKCFEEEKGLNFLKDVLDLINRQRAEIERLDKEVDRLSQCVLYHDGQIADAVKDFAERLKTCLYDKPSIFTQQRYIVNDEIDKLVKEMTGGGTDGGN